MTKANSLVLTLPKGLRQFARDLLPPFLTRLIDRLLHRGDVPRPPSSAPLRWPALETKLWGGFSDKALRDLETLRGDPSSPPMEVAGAARVLAGWYASSGQAKPAYENALLARTAEPRLARHELHIMLETDALLEVGNVSLARRILGKAVERHPSNGLYYAMANTFATPRESVAADEDARLRWMNRPLEAAGLAPLAKIDPKGPLSIENLTADVPREAHTKAGHGPKVSVIVPAFRAEETLPIALSGLLAQTWANLEIIVVDDLSPDRTYDVARSFAEKDPRFSAIQQESNQGAYAARNLGLRQATGEFVTVHDADDWSHPQKIALQVEHLLENPAISANLTDWIRCLPHLYFRSRARAVLSWIHFNHSSLLLRRELLEAMGGWDDVRIAADSELIRRLERAGKGQRLPRIHHGVPLSLALVAQTSLTQQSATHARTLRHGVRRTYYEASQHWLEQVADPSASVRATPERPFPVPPFILPMRGSTRQVECLFLQDFMAPGQAFAQTFRDIEALRDSGKKAGVFHWPHYESDVSRPLPDVLWATARTAGLAIVTPGEVLDAVTVVCRTPAALLEQIDLVPSIRCQRFVCPTDAALELADADRARFTEIVQRHFAVEPLWVSEFSPSGTDAGRASA